MTIEKQIIHQLNQLNISPRKFLGQNYLVSENIIQKILNIISKTSPQNIIEIGPGLGALTKGLKKMKIPLTAIELDSSLAQYWKKQGLNVIKADALKINWKQIANTPDTHIVSNLPFQIASRLLVLMTQNSYQIKWMTLMFQKEVAQKITSSPSKKNYGFLSVVSQLGWHIRFILEAGPNEFYPRPKVASRVLHFTKKEISLPPSLIFFLKQAFHNKRKKLINNFKQKDKNKLILSLKKMDLDENLRAEALSPQQFQKLFRCFQNEYQNNF